MKLLTLEQLTALAKNGLANATLRDNGLDEHDFPPVVKLFCPWGAATWLLSELDPDDPDIAFGLCDLGVGCPELGTVRISELHAVRAPGGLRVERDRYFKPKKPSTPTPTRPCASAASTREGGGHDPNRPPAPPRRLRRHHQPDRRRPRSW